MKINIRYSISQVYHLFFVDFYYHVGWRSFAQIMAWVCRIRQLNNYLLGIYISKSMCRKGTVSTTSSPILFSLDNLEKPRKAILGYENVYLDLFEYFGLGHTRRHDYDRSRPEKYVNWTGYHKKLDRILLIHHCFAITYILIACYVVCCYWEMSVTWPPHTSNRTSHRESIGD